METFRGVSNVWMHISWPGNSVPRDCYFRRLFFLRFENAVIFSPGFITARGVYMKARECYTYKFLLSEKILRLIEHVKVSPCTRCSANKVVDVIKFQYTEKVNISASISTLSLSLSLVSAKNVALIRKTLPLSQAPPNKKTYVSVRSVGFLV